MLQLANKIYHRSTCKHIVSDLGARNIIQRTQQQNTCMYVKQNSNNNNIDDSHKGKMRTASWK